VHQVGFSLRDYIETHGQQNKKKLGSKFVFTARMIGNTKVQPVKKIVSTANVKRGGGPNYSNCVRVQGSRLEQKSTQQNRTDNSRSEKYTADQSRPYQNRKVHSRTQQTIPDQKSTQQTRADHTRTEKYTAEHSTPYQTRNVNSRPEQTIPD